MPGPVVIDKDYPLATATFGLPSLRIDDPDFPALQVLNHIIGSGDFDSRLMEEIRVKRGLAYSVQTRLLRDSITSLMVGGVATKNEAMGTTLDVMRDVFADMARNGPTPVPVRQCQAVPDRLVSAGLRHQRKGGQLFAAASSSRAKAPTIS